MLPSYLVTSYICTIHNGYQMVTVPKLILQTLRKIPTVTFVLPNVYATII